MTVSTKSRLQQIAELPPKELAAWRSSLTEEEMLLLPFMWEMNARPSQVPPEGDWRTWLIMAGRGWGKTRTGAEFVRARIDAGLAKNIIIVGATTGDVRDVMLDGVSGLMHVWPDHQKPHHIPSKRLVIAHNGARITTISAEEPDRLRGPNSDLAWADELAAWRYEEAWEMLQLGLRIGPNPQAVVTTTPKPKPLVRNLIAGAEKVQPDGHRPVVITSGATYENTANLSPMFLQTLAERYAGTRLGRQEIFAELLLDVEGALWHRDMIDKHRVEEAPEKITQIAVGVDPATSPAGTAGIVAVGRDLKRHGYVLADDSVSGTPDEWARQAVKTYHSLEANYIVAETNQGGDMVKAILHHMAPHAVVKTVRASRAKQARAEPVAALAEQGKLHHVGTFNDLEDELCCWEPGQEDSPDRLDAMVWAATHQLVHGGPAPIVLSGGVTSPSRWKYV